MWMLYPLIFLAGMVDSIAGGGGLIAVPAYLAAGLPPHVALGTNKLSSVSGALVASIRFGRRGHIEWRVALLALAGALVGSPVGAAAVLLIPEQAVRVMMLVLVPAVAVFLLVRRQGNAQRGAPGRVRLIVSSVLIGAAVGMYDGFFGPGTGTFFILAFTSLLGMELLAACGTTKVVNFTSNIAALVAFALGGSISYRVGIPCAVCNILGQALGSELAMRKGAGIVRPTMAVVIVLLLGKIAWDLLQA